MKRPQSDNQLAQITVDDGLGKNTMILLATSSATIIISVAIAVAVARISTGIMWAAIITATGNAIHLTLTGWGQMRRHVLIGQAQLEAARGQARAAHIAARARRSLPPSHSQDE